MGNFVVEVELAEPSAVKVQFDLLAQRAIVSDVPKLPFNLVRDGLLDRWGVCWADWVEIRPREFEVNARELLESYSRGAIEPIISRRFSLDEGSKAIQLLAARSAVGKIIVMVD